jgi:hypothetical protein
MDRLGSMELVHKPVQVVLALVPESVTRDFYLPVVNISDPKVN